MCTIFKLHPTLGRTATGTTITCMCRRRAKKTAHKRTNCLIRLLAHILPNTLTTFSISTNSFPEPPMNNYGFYLECHVGRVDEPEYGN